MKKYIIVGISALAGGIFGFMGADHIYRSGGSFLHLVGLIVCMLITFYAQIIIHEGGHLLFGLLTGYHFVSFRIGSFMVYKKQGKLKTARFSLAGTGGQCLLAPPEWNDGTFKYVLYNLGGVILNLATAGICVLILWSAGAVFPLSEIFVLLIFFGLFFAITNGIPMQVGGVANDGKNTLDLSKNKSALRALWVQLKVNEATTEGIRLKEMPEEWFEMPSEENMDNPMTATLAVFRCNRLMDEGDLEKAGQEIETLLAKDNGVLGVYRSLLTLDLIYCELFGERRAKILKKIEKKEMIQFMKAMKNFPSVLRTQYAYALLVETDVKKAQRLKKQFQKMERHYPHEQDVKSEWELICRCD